MLSIPSINSGLFIEPTQWVTDNIQDITESMEVLSAKRYTEALVTPEDLPLFDRNNRLLSEMEICDFSLYLPPPSGYELVRNGLIKTEISGKPNMFTHYYYQRIDFPIEIICLTFGQFVHPKETTLKRGDRIRILIDKTISQQNKPNPQLISKISPEIYCLSGNRREIGKTLGIYYG